MTTSTNRAKHWAGRLFRINPIVVKEIRSRMRGARAFITLTILLLMMGGAMFGMLQIILAQSRYTTVLSPQIGQALFAALAFLLLFMIAAVTPAVTAGAISGEKEKQTYEMLMATPLSPGSVLWGKLISALSYIFLLIFAGIPLASVVFIFGGVAPREMFKSLMVLLVMAMTFGVLGLFMSALFGRTGRATVATFITVIMMLLGPLFLTVLIAALRNGEPPRLLLAPSPISALSSALASSMGSGGGGELFYILGGIFNSGMNPVSLNGIPRPLYHFSLPFYILLSTILYLISTRLVQPTRRWRIPLQDLLVGIAIVSVLLAVFAGLYAMTTSRYEGARNPNANQMFEPDMPFPVKDRPAIAVEQRVVQVGTDPMTSTNNQLDSETQANVYATAARQLLTVDHGFGDQPITWSGLYLMTVTNDAAGAPDQPIGQPITLEKDVLSGVASRLNDLNMKVMWIESEEALAGERDPQNGRLNEGRSVLITFGNIYLQSDGRMTVSASLYVNGLHNVRRTYTISGLDGKWIVMESMGTE